MRDEKNPSPRLARIQLHPIKSLDSLEVSSATIGPSGSLLFDRAWALYSLDGRLIPSSRTPALHKIRATYSPSFSTVTLSAPSDPRRLPTKSFNFPADTESAAVWFSNYLQKATIVRHHPEGRPDDLIASGPTIISTASLQAVMDWFPEISLSQARLRFRSNLELDGVPKFFEDRLFGPEERSMIRFRIGDIAFEGSHPTIRCPVPARDPHTGVDTIGFQKHFTMQRQAHLPAWSYAERFEHFYCLATSTRVPSAEAGKILRVGDALVFDQPN